MARVGALAMEARGAQNAAPRHQNAPQEIQDEALERQDGSSECPNGCPDGPWQPDLLLEVFPNANFTVPGSLWDWFWKLRGSYWERTNRNFEQKMTFRAILCIRFHSIPFTWLHCIVFHSILSGLPEFRNRMLLNARVVLFGSRDARLLGQSWEELVLGDLPPSGCEKFV